MQIVVLGAGAIGSLYGAKLAGGNEVTLLGRSDHVAAIEQHGLRIEGLETLTVQVHATTCVDKLKPDTLILLTTKVPATVAALQPIAPLIRDDTTIVALQNGLNGDEIARAAINDCGVVLRGITKFGAIVDRRLTRLKQLVIDECVAVAAAEGIRLDEDFMREINSTYAGSQTIVSMRQDLLRGRQTEIDYLSGAVAARGARHGVDCPVNDALTRIIKGMEGASRNNRGGPRLPPPQELQTKTITRAGVRAPEINSSEIIR